MAILVWYRRDRGYPPCGAASQGARADQVKVLFPSSPAQAAEIVSRLAPGEVAETDCNCGGTVSFRVTDAKGMQWAHSEPVCAEWQAHARKAEAVLK